MSDAKNRGAPPDDGGSAPKRERLDELAEVTREYARYSRTAFGLAFIGAGVSVMATVALDVIVRWAWARFGYLLLPAVWLVLLAGSRAYYQRHGQVVEPHQRFGGRGWLLAFVYLTCAADVVYLAGAGFDLARGSASGPFVVVVAIFGLVAAPVLTGEIVRGKADAWFTFALAAVALPWSMMPARSGSELANLNQAFAAIRALLLLLLCFLPVAAVIGGIRDHVRYSALERRLAALRAERT